VFRSRLIRNVVVYTALPILVGASAFGRPTGLVAHSPTRGKPGPTVDPKPLHLVVSDRYGFDAAFTDLVGGEVLGILGGMGVGATWSLEELPVGDGDAPRPAGAGAESFFVLLSGASPAAWGVKDRAMGTVVPNENRRRRLLVFPTRVLRVLGLDRRSGRPPLAFHNLETARALARVVVHELIHALSPDHSHAAGGLMRGTLNRKFLLRPDLPIDSECRAALQSALPLLLAEPEGH